MDSGASGRDFFFEAEAQGIADVGAVGRDAVEAPGFVEGDGFGLANPGFEAEELVAEMGGGFLQCGEQKAGDALAAELGKDIHAPDFSGGAVVHGAQGGAGDGFTGEAGDEEGAARAGWIVRYRGGGGFDDVAVAVQDFGAHRIGQSEGVFTLRVGGGESDR